MTCNMIGFISRVLRPHSGIYIINNSTMVSDDDVRKWVAACSRQIAEHVAPVYHRQPVRVQFLNKTSHAPTRSWVIGVLDNADQAGVLGWHTQDRLGRIYGRVFVGPCLEYGVPVSTTLSHEITETYCDPAVDRWVNTGRGYSVPYEACDPVEGDAYEIDGVAVSDFVGPGWYGVGGRIRWMMDHELEPFNLAPGGYVVRRWGDGTEDEEFGRNANRQYIDAKRHSTGRAMRRKHRA